MIPYADFLYFAVLAIYIVVPTILIRAVRGFSRLWIVVATILMLWVQYGDILRTGSGANKVSAEDWQIDVPGIWVIVGYAVFQWLNARLFLAFRSRGKRYGSYLATLVLALAPLVVVKLVPHFVSQSIVGFVGISYLTFRGLDVVFSIQDGLITSLPPAQYLAFLCFFPTTSSGPIDRYRRFAADWNRPRSRADFLVDLDTAVHRIFNGFLLKFILAALVERYWMNPLDPFKHTLGSLSLLGFMYAYSFFLFFDFAGYSEFAIGTSYLLGIRTPENFNRPYLAHNIRDFWNRWHMTLTGWLRDHVYMRFLLASTKGKWFSNKQMAPYLAIFLSFGIMGLWHGTEFYYLLYGLYHACLMAAFEVFSQWNKRHKVWGEGLPWRCAGVVITFHLVCAGFLLFSGRIGPHL